MNLKFSVYKQLFSSLLKKKTACLNPLMDPSQLQDKNSFESERMNCWALLDKPVRSEVQFQNHMSLMHCCLCCLPVLAQLKGFTGACLLWHCSPILEFLICCVVALSPDNSHDSLLPHPQIMKTDDPSRKKKWKGTWVFLSGFPTLIIKNGNILIFLHCLPAGLSLKLPDIF